MKGYRERLLRALAQSDKAANGLEHLPLLRKLQIVLVSPLRFQRFPLNLRRFKGRNSSRTNGSASAATKVQLLVKLVGPEVNPLQSQGTTQSLPVCACLCLDSK